MTFIIAIAIAAIIGFFVGKDANDRGMSAVGWGLGAFLFSIVAVPVYLIVRKPLRNVDQGAIAPDANVRCPDCRELVRFDAAVCKHCRCKLVPQAVGDSSASNEGQCTRCAEVIPLASKKCPKCRAEFGYNAMYKVAPVGRPAEGIKDTTSS